MEELEEGIWRVVGKNGCEDRQRKSLQDSGYHRNANAMMDVQSHV